MLAKSRYVYPQHNDKATVYLRVGGDGTRH
jgi:hypothetical protein